MSLDQISQSTNLHKRNEVQFLCFRLIEGGDIYAVNVFKVKEIIKYTDTVTQIDHNESSLLEGIITVRETIYPLVDLRKWFYYEPDFPDRELKSKANQNLYDFQVLICDFSQMMLAIKIHKAERILTKKWSDIHQIDSYSKSEHDRKVINHTRYFDNSLVKVVNVEKMLVDVFPNIESTQDSEIDNLDKIEAQKIVLLAEDSPVAMKVMKRILTKLNVEFKAFDNGQELLDYLEKPTTDLERVGLIITDLEMPLASGFEVIKQVKSNKSYSHIPITVNSSMSGKSNQEMAESLNAEAFISKSKPKEVEQAVRRFVK